MLAFAIDDSAFGQIVRREFHADLVPGDDTDEVLAHPAGNMRHHLASRVQLNTETRIGESLCDGAFYFKGVFFFSQNQTSTEGKLSGGNP